MKQVPELDPGFVPAFLWRQTYDALVKQSGHARSVVLALMRPDGTAYLHRCRILPEQHPQAGFSLRYIERTLKFLLWQKGGSRVMLAGAPEVAAALAQIYSSQGARAFDYQFMGDTVYGEPFSVQAVSLEEIPAENDPRIEAGRNTKGCRIGFDLGGSDRKAAAVIDGRVVFSEEISWSPYFEKDPAYHLKGVEDSIARAAAHLPRVDAIGGSTAGVVVNNEVRIASLFRGVAPKDFQEHIRRMFFTLQAKWGGVPFVVANDGEVTALAGALSLGVNPVLGVSMGTSQAGGYVTSEGALTGWLNELAFAPVDYREDAPRDEWAGDAGCGVQYFSQQAVDRLARKAGFVFPETLPLAERLSEVQAALAAGDERARAVFSTIGTYFGYGLAHYSEFYELRHVLLLGRVTSGAAGDIICRQSRAVLEAEQPSLASQLSIHLPDEKSKRHGQAIAAAFLPKLSE